MRKGGYEEAVVRKRHFRIIQCLFYVCSGILILMGRARGTNLYCTAKQNLSPQYQFDAIADKLLELPITATHDGV